MKEMTDRNRPPPKKKSIFLNAFPYLSRGLYPLYLRPEYPDPEPVYLRLEVEKLVPVPPPDQLQAGGGAEVHQSTTLFPPRLYLGGHLMFMFVKCRPLTTDPLLRVRGQ